MVKGYTTVCWFEARLRAMWQLAHFFHYFVLASKKNTSKKMMVLPGEAEKLLLKYLRTSLTEAGQISQDFPQKH